MYTVHGRGADLFSFAFRPLFNIGTDKSAANLGATLRHICTRVIHLTQTHLYVEHHKEKQYHF